MSDTRRRESHIAIECCSCRYTTGWQPDLCRAKQKLGKDGGGIRETPEGLLLVCPEGHDRTRIETD